MVYLPYKHLQRLLAVASDSHGNYNALEQLLMENPNIDGLLFLGDGMREFEDLQSVHPNLPMVGVPGNCDYSYREPHTRIYQDRELRIMLTHGHYYHVKSGLEYLLEAARASNVSAVLYGHTHQERAEREANGLWVINPGSLGFSRTYALLEVSQQGIQAELRSLSR